MKSIDFCTEIYSIATIQKAVEAYDKLVKIKVILNGNRMVLEFHNCRYDEDLTLKEFENYLIGLENS